VLDATTSVAVLPLPHLPLPLKINLLQRESSLGDSTVNAETAKKAVVEAAIAIAVAVAVVHSTSTAKPARPTLTKKVHNSWGGDDGNAERKVEEAATIDAAVEDASGLNEWAAPAAEGGADDWGAPPATDDAPPADGAEKPQGERRERRGDKEEEEDHTLTLDQYLAQQREKDNALVPKLEVRKPNEGAEDDLFKGAAQLKKDEEEEYFAGKTKSAPKARAKKEDKVFIEIEARFERPNRGTRGGRGGDRGGERGRGERGGRGRGGRGRGGGANGHSRPSTVNVDDENAFPSLS